MHEGKNLWLPWIFSDHGPSQSGRMKIASWPKENVTWCTRVMLDSLFPLCLVKNTALVPESKWWSRLIIMIIITVTYKPNSEMSNCELVMKIGLKKWQVTLKSFPLYPLEGVGELLSKSTLSSSLGAPQQGWSGTSGRKVQGDISVRGSALILLLYTCQRWRGRWRNGGSPWLLWCSVWAGGVPRDAHIPSDKQHIRDDRQEKNNIGSDCPERWGLVLLREGLDGIFWAWVSTAVSLTQYSSCLKWVIILEFWLQAMEKYTQ